MKTIKLATAVATLASAGCFASFAYAAAVPCEDKLVELRAAIAKTTLGDADMKPVKTLEAKGVERCNADDDKRADAFFDDALKLLKN
ncbi:hypothetical protein [Chenggangzhangella methanolivorans]|uniref:Uncharacterized protein n=1 Tax=Chenggangzhangella methanolivorans TaxID=1437009 RepID=A0A9E6RDN1_9HYPH|nr:hypothetical protein [Chenggangzhangella methanolivorans]QZN98866.1 hypothetical protein K6K41_18335 [Chenggangzhangella methanolivorans]